MTIPRVLAWSREIVEAAERHGLPADLVASIVEQESAGEPGARRFEPAYRWFVTRGGVIVPPDGVTADEEREQQATSWGLMQVMGAVLREQGCELPYLDEILGDVSAQLAAGCRHLSGMVKRFGSIDRAVSAYNAGRPQPPESTQWRNYVQPVLARRGDYRRALLTGEP